MSAISFVCTDILVEVNTRFFGRKWYRISVPLLGRKRKRSAIRRIFPEWEVTVKIAFGFGFLVTNFSLFQCPATRIESYNAKKASRLPDWTPSDQSHRRQVIES